MASAQGIRAGRAYVEASLDDSKLSRGMKAVESRLKGWGSSIAGIGAKLGALGATVTAPLFAAAKTFADAGSELADASARTGVSVEVLSELSHAAQQTGADMAAVETGIRKMQRSLGDAVSGSKSARDAIDGLGLSVQELAAMSPDKQFHAVARAIGAIPDPTLKAAAAMDLFGKSGTALLPMIDDIDVLTKEARDLGLVWSTEDAAAADQLGDAMDNLWAMVNRGVALIGSALTPDLIALGGVILRVAKTTLDWIAANRPLVAMVARIAAGALAAGAALTALGLSLQVAGVAVGGLTAAIGAMLSPLVLVTAGLTAGAIAFLKYTDVGGQALSWLGTQFGALKTDAEAAFEGIADALRAGDIPLAGEILWAALKVQWLKGTAALTAIWTDWSTAVKQVFSDVSFAIARGWSALVGGMGIAVLEMVNVLDEAFTTIKFLIDSAMGKVDLFAGEDLKKRIAERTNKQLGIVGRVGQEQAALNDQQNAADEARRKAAHAAIDAASADLAAARAAFDALRGKAAGAGGGGIPVKPGILPPDFTPEGLRATLQAAQAKVSAKGTFSASALRGLGVGDTAKDQLAESREMNKKLDRIDNHIRQAGAVFGA